MTEPSATWLGRISVGPAPIALPPGSCSSLPGVPVDVVGKGYNVVKGLLDSVTYEDKETADTSLNDLKQFVLKDPKLKKLVVQGAAEAKRLKSNGPR